MDRTCIEKIRSFQNPPQLIGQVIEMVMVLIGKKKLFGIGGAASSSLAAGFDQIMSSARRDEAEGGHNATTGTSTNMSKMSTVDGTKPAQRSPKMGS